MAALSFNNSRQKPSTNTTNWSTQRQQLFMRKQYSFIETGNNSLHIVSSNNGNGLTRGLSIGRSYDGIRQKLNAPPVSLRHAGSQVYLQRQTTFDQDLKFKSNIKSKEIFLKNSRAAALSNSTTRLNYTRSTNSSEKSKFKQKSIVAWPSTSSLLKSFDDDNAQHLRRKSGCGVDFNSENKVKDTRKASTTTSNTAQHHQLSHSLSKGEASKINLSIVLPQAVKTSIDETVFSDIESSLDSGVDTDTASSQPAKIKDSTKIGTSVKPLAQSVNSLSQPIITIQNNTTNLNYSALHRRAQFRSNRNETVVNNTTIANNISQAVEANNNTLITTTSVSQPLTTTTTAKTFSVSPSLSVQRRPPLVRAMSAPVRSLDDFSKGNFTANKRKPRRRKVITRNISCDKTTEQDFLTNEIINGKNVLTRSRSVVSTDVITLVSLMSSEGSDSEKEDSAQTSTNGISAKSEKSPMKRAPSLRKTGKSVSFQENYPPNFQLASKEYSHMIRRASIAPLTARLRTNRPPTAPPVSVFLNMSNNAEINKTKIGNTTTESSTLKDTIENRAPMSEKVNNKEMNSSTSISNSDQNTDYVFPNYVRSIKERECWKLYQKMCNKGVNVSYDTILRGMLTPTEFRQLQKQRELEETKARELAEAENEAENVKPQSAIDRLSEALLKK